MTDQPSHPPAARPLAASAPAVALDTALYERVVGAVTRAGAMHEEGDRLSWVYNGDTLAIKYTEPGEEEGQVARLLVAVFRQGVVFQVEGERAVVQRPGDWEAQLDALDVVEEE